LRQPKDRLLCFCEAGRRGTGPKHDHYLGRQVITVEFGLWPSVKNSLHAPGSSNLMKTELPMSEQGKFEISAQDV